MDALASDGKRVFVGGDFEFLGPPGGKFALFSAPDGDTVPTTAAVAGPGAVDAIVSDGAGGWFLGGTFTFVAGVRCPRLAHVRANQRLDRRFCLGPNRGVRALARRGSVLYVGGDFTRIGRSKRLRLAAVDTRNGTLRPWNPGVTGEPVPDSSVLILPSVDAIVASPSRIYVGGAFQRVGGMARKNVAALNPRTGRTLDWQVDVQGGPGEPSRYVFDTVGTLALLKGVLYIGGYFSAVAGRSRPGLAALDATTGELTPWSPSVSGSVTALVATASAVYAAPSYFSSEDASGIFVLNRRTGRRISWIRSQSTVPRFDAFAVAGSTLFVGGEFDRLGGLPRSNVAAIDLRAHRVTDWQPAFDGPVLALAAADGKLAVGGRFDTTGVTAHRDLAALKPESGRPLPLQMDVEGELFAGVKALAVGDSTLYVGGYFTGIEGVERRDLAAIDLDEGRLTEWRPRIQRYSEGNGLLAEHDGVLYLAPQPDDYEPPLRAVDTQSAEVLPWRAEPEDYGEPVGAIAAGGSRVYLAGDFRSIGGVTRRTLAALDAENGEVLPWDPRPNGEEGAVALAIYDGTLYVGGDFTEIAGAPRLGAAAFDVESGKLLEWAPRLRGGTPPGPGTPYAFAAHESAVFLGGDFESVGGKQRDAVAAVDPVTGRLLPWRLDLDLQDFDAVRHLVVAGSTLYLAGDFESVNGVPQKGLAAVRLR